MTRFGYFLKLFGDNFLQELSKYLLIFWVFWNMSLFQIIKMHWLLLGQLLEDLGNFFIPTSGHTDCQSRTVLSFVPIYLFARVFIGLSGIVHVCVWMLLSISSGCLKWFIGGSKIDLQLYWAHFHKHSPTLIMILR